MTRININEYSMDNQAKYEGYIDLIPNIKTNRMTVSAHIVATLINRTSAYVVGGDEPYNFYIKYFTDKKNPDDADNQETWSGSGVYRTDKKIGQTYVQEQTIPAGQNFSITFDGTGELIPFKDGVLHLYNYTSYGSTYNGGISFDCDLNPIDFNRRFVNPGDAAERVSNGNIKVNGNWKHSFPWKKINGVWKRCKIWEKISGIWKLGK